MLRLLIIACTIVPLCLSHPAIAGFVPIGQKVLPRLHVILIASAAYPGPPLNRLEYPIPDAKLLERTFRDLGGRIDLAQLVVLVDQPKQKILQAVAEVAAKANEADGTTIVYWTGHSYLDELSNTLTLLPVDTRVKSDSNPVAIDNAIDFVSDLLKLFRRDQRLLFVGDGCNIGEALVGRAAIDWPNLVVLSASKSDEPSIDGIKELGHSPLSYYFAEALRDPIADEDGDGLISVDELFMHVYPRVLKAGRSMGYVQHPAMFGRFSHRTMLAVAKQDDRGKLALKLEPLALASLTGNGRITVNGDTLTGPYEIRDGALLVDPKQATKVRDGLNLVEVSQQPNMTDAVKAYNLWREADKVEPFELFYKHSHAIVIAVGDYERKRDPLKRHPTGLDEVPRMVETARTLVSVLKGLGFETVHELYDDQVTVANIDGLLKQYWKGEVNGNVDRLFIYFGAHGVPYKDAAGQRRVLLATYDYDQTKVLSTNYLASDLFERHSDNIGAHHVMIVIDACSAGFARTGSLMSAEAILGDAQIAKIKLLQTFKDEMEKSARNVLVAGREDQQAVTEDGRSVFAMKLIEALKGKADRDNKGYWKASDVQSWVKSQVSLEATALRRKQQPTSWNLSAFGDGEMLFYPHAAADAAAAR